MWYVVQVQARHEIVVCGQMRERVLTENEDAFVLQAERRHRERDGDWTTVLVPAFQKYIFAEITDLTDFRVRLRRIKEMTKLLESGGEIAPISESEEMLLSQLGGEDHIIRLSSGYIIGGKAIVTGGPLKGREGLVRWTNPRQGLIGIEVALFGRSARVKLGMEYVSPVKAG